MQYQVDLVLQTRDNDQISFWIIQKVQKPRQAYFMNHCSSVAHISRVSSPQVSLSISKISISSDLYFLSSGSFNMATKRKNRVNQGHSGLIISWTGFLPDMRFSQGVQKRTQLSKKQPFKVTFMCHFSSKFDYVPKMTRFDNYWMIRIFPGKSGSVSFLSLSMPNFLPKILEIWIWEVW